MHGIQIGADIYNADLFTLVGNVSEQLNVIILEQDIVCFRIWIRKVDKPCRRFSVTDEFIAIRPEDCCCLNMFLFLLRFMGNRN